MAKKKKEPDILYSKGQNLLEINAQDKGIKKYQTEILNIVNKHGHGNDATIVGMVSQVIKDYRKNVVGTPTLEGWEEYHKNLTNIQGIEVGVKRNLDMFKTMLKAINDIDEETIRIWLKNLVYNKTFAGLQAQDMVLKDIANKLSVKKGQEYKYENGDSTDERAQIDGYIIAPDGKLCGLQIKSDSYRSHNTVEGTAPVLYVYYKLEEKGLSYKIDLDKLKFVDKTIYDGIKSQVQKKYEDQLKKEEEKKRKEIEKEQRKAERAKKRAEREVKAKAREEKKRNREEAKI